MSWLEGFRRTRGTDLRSSFVDLFWMDVHPFHFRRDAGSRWLVKHEYFDVSPCPMMMSSALRYTPFERGDWVSVAILFPVLPELD